MNLFGKLNEIKNKKKLEKEVNYRLTIIIQEIGKIMADKNVNYYEAMDIVRGLQSDLNLKVAKLLQDQQNIIKHLENQVKELSKIETV